MAIEGEQAVHPKTCPNCESIDTELQWTDNETDAVVHVRTCNDCPTEYTVEFGDPIYREVTTYDE